jgi:3-dehydroquinate synthase
LLINLGGGVVTDLGGFVAGAYKRGIDFINIPTTLLAQVDATIGGKTGIDFGAIKNGIGLFNFPKMVYIHTPFLKTLDDAQLLSGFAEMLKHGLIGSNSDWNDISHIEPLKTDHWGTLIYKSLQVKANIVLQDPFETGLRKVLNFGHTIGHALEGLALEQGKTMLHGHAVAFGMVAELWLSAQKTGFPNSDVQKITTTLLNLYGGYYNIDQNTDGLAALLLNDKKNKQGQLSFVLLKAIGHPVINISCSMDEVRAALNYLEDQL